MDHTVRVGVFQRLGNLLQDVDRVPHSEASGGETRPERLAFGKRHRVVRQSFGARRHLDLAGRDHEDDMRMLKPGRELNLALESLDVESLRELGREDLDDDRPAEPALGRDEHSGHTAAAELTLDRVAVG